MTAYPKERTNLVCGDCGSVMRLRESRYGPFYSCTQYPACRGSHGAHPDGAPLGVPADKATKEARIAAHNAFDEWWRSRGMTRAEAYEWLERHGPQPHIGEMSEAECDDLVALIEEATR